MSPRARCPFLPPPPPSSSFQPFSRTKHRADGLTRRSNLSLSLFPFPLLLFGLLFSFVPYPSRPFTPALLQQPPTRWFLFLYLVCHFAPPCVARLSFLAPNILPLVLSHSSSSFSTMCLCFRLYRPLSPSLLAPSSLPQIAPKLSSPLGDSRNDSSLERGSWKKVDFRLTRSRRCRNDKKRYILVGTPRIETYM